MQMNLSDSMVVLVKVTNCASTPTAGSCWWRERVGVGVGGRGLEEVRGRRRRGRAWKRTERKKETIAAVARPFLLVFSGGLTLLNDLPRACDVKRNPFLTPQAKEGMEKRSRRRREREQKEAKKEHGRRKKPIAERTTTATRGG